ncbi:hypothetical protein ENSA5_04680 [Enhygromyxa salina]|uniref:Pyridoxamine 5'-phosphate oxidase putative domain-containing protein n=1 Tax=Enhygromyxa salina TaxID=215803 RepID=A0A2S9YIJ2_9BACT|nr:hypothetical protein [Enhygromyxa salina]PRQ04890.1 hypothetical protein ENSA5_04680 [Enhygromyxa salina]
MAKPSEPDPVSALMRLLTEHWVLTLALADQPAPYPTPLFYALAEPDTIGRHAAPLLVFASDPDSHHGRLAGSSPTAAAAALYLETETPGQIRGAQLRGTLVREERFTTAGATKLRARYLARHGVAEPTLAAGRHRLYALIVTWAKLTDNRLGFGVHPTASFEAACSEVRAGAEADRPAGSSGAEVEQSQA